jgi:type III secretion system-like peptide-binding chaperone
VSMQRVRRQVAAILENNGLRWSQADEALALRFSSAVVQLSFGMSGRQVLIHLQSPVLQELQPGAGDNAELLRELNSLNAASVFGKWVLYETERVVNLEYDLLGDHLQEDELMTDRGRIGRSAGRPPR